VFGVYGTDTSFINIPQPPGMDGFWDVGAARQGVSGQNEGVCMRLKYFVMCVCVGG